MAQLIEYEKMDKMLPREGVTYSTVYVKQTEHQRRALCNHIFTSVREIRDYVENCNDPEDWLNWMQTPLKGFKKTAGTNRTVIELINDLLAEANGKKKNGDLKDFALAPIERWNKLFKDTDYEIVLEKDLGYQHVKSLFKGL
jgi:hypothetical protein